MSAHDISVAPTLERLAALASRVQRAPDTFHHARDLAHWLDCDAGQLDHLVREQFHMSPARWLTDVRTRRATVLLAKPAPDIHAIAAAVGFADAAGLQRHVKRHTGMPAAQYAQLGRGPRDARVGFELTLPRGFDTTAAFSILKRDAAGVCEQVTGAVFSKAFESADRAWLLTATHAGQTLHCRVTGARVPGPRILRDAHRLAVRLLGLRGDVTGLARTVYEQPALRALVAKRPGLRVPLMGSPFEALCWAIIGQQINLTFASALRADMIRLTGKRLPDGRFAHPDAGAVARLDPADLRAVRFSRSKADYLIAAARAISAGALMNPARLQPASLLREELLTQRGIGPWTCNYVLMRGYGLADCVPAGDAGLAKALQRLLGLETRPDAAMQDQLLAPYSPHRSLLCQHLWAG